MIFKGDMTRTIVASALLLSLFPFFSASPEAQDVGEPLPPWTTGTLDIHHINTAMGDSTFLVLPDGTTLLVDAGAAPRRPGARGTPPRPNGSRAPGEWIARYIEHMLTPESSSGLDYGFLTHFHADHMGALFPDSKVSASHQYTLTGITDVGERARIGKMLDRGWPDYDFPRPLTDAMMQNYRAFLKWQVEHNGMEVERLQPGRNDQIVLTRAPTEYPNFEVRNIAANGEIWTGVGTETRSRFPRGWEQLPDADQPTENMCSMAIRVSYGPFDYYTGGDMPGIPDEGAPSWHDIETPVAQAVGPVEVALLNHHGYLDSTNAFFVSALRPRTIIIPVRDATHPGSRVVRRLYSTRLYPGPRGVFATNLIAASRAVIGPLYDNFKSTQGHILVRVAPGGKEYRVIILDDTAETYKVIAVHGPYQAS